MLSVSLWLTVVSKHGVYIKMYPGFASTQKSARKSDGWDAKESFDIFGNYVLKCPIYGTP